jgi:hypothetical protein
MPKLPLPGYFVSDMRLNYDLTQVIGKQLNVIIVALNNVLDEPIRLQWLGVSLRISASLRCTSLQCLHPIPNPGGDVYHQAGFFPQAGRHWMATLRVGFLTLFTRSRCNTCYRLPPFLGKQTHSSLCVTHFSSSPFFPILIASSCQRESSADVNQDRIFTHYELFYNANDRHHLRPCLVPVWEHHGHSLELASPSEVTF